jgi:hypothetical protein
VPVLSHVKSNVVADMTGTVTVFNSAGSTTTVAATDVVRPSDWNSAHQQYLTISGNTAGTSAATATNVVFGGTNGITVSLSTAAGGATVYFDGHQNRIMGEVQPWQAFAHSMATNSALGQNSLYFAPFDLADDVYASRLNVFLSVLTAISASNTTGSGGHTLSVALYARDTVNTYNITSFWSNSVAWRWSMSSNTNVSITNPVGVNGADVSTEQYASNNANASTYAANSVGGYRVVAFPVGATGSSLSPGRYWIAMANSRASVHASQNIALSVGQFAAGGIAQIAYAPVGTSSVASNASRNLAFWPGAWTYSATSAAFPGTVPISSDSIRAGLTLTLPGFNFSGYATGKSLI